MKYKDYRTIAKTGDIFLKEGDGLASKAIQIGQLIGGFPWREARFSHVGFVVKDEAHDQLFVWHASYGEGVVVRLASEFFDKQHNWYVRGRKTQLREDQLLEFSRLRKELEGREYEDNYLELLGSAWNLVKPCEDLAYGGLTKVFCSELVAAGQDWVGELTGFDGYHKVCPAEVASRTNCFAEHFGKITRLEID